VCARGRFPAANARKSSAGLAGDRWVRAFAEGVVIDVGVVGEGLNAVGNIDELASGSYLRQNCSPCSPCFRKTSERR
jgi:hypothetical protein